MAAARIRRFTRRILSVTALATIAMVLPAVSSVPAHKVEFRMAPVVKVAQIPGAGISDRFITIRIDGAQHRLRTSGRDMFLAPGNAACVSKRTLLREHKIIYSMKPDENCARL
ncbi:hypothetical protein [Roseobacter sp. S98]|uniref:hypothetical protein n=1 Tax=Roseobacter algicola (ex Choi et al. 2025) (nom. illeg.) TaxID=3092138 RepID=UPI0035C665BB